MLCNVPKNTYTDTVLSKYDNNNNNNNILYILQYRLVECDGGMNQFIMTWIEQNFIRKNINIKPSSCSIPSHHVRTAAANGRTTKIPTDDAHEI
jgi:hypothetical protein